jgi:hypothetical protein
MSSCLCCWEPCCRTHTDTWTCLSLQSTVFTAKWSFGVLGVLQAEVRLNPPASEAENQPTYPNWSVGSLLGPPASPLSRCAALCPAGTQYRPHVVSSASQHRGEILGSHLFLDGQTWGRQHFAVKQGHQPPSCHSDVRPWCALK